MYRISLSVHMCVCMEIYTWTHVYEYVHVVVSRASVVNGVSYRGDGPVGPTGRPPAQREARPRTWLCGRPRVRLGFLRFPLLSSDPPSLRAAVRASSFLRLPASPSCCLSRHLSPASPLTCRGRCPVLSSVCPPAGCHRARRCPGRPLLLLRRSSARPWAAAQISPREGSRRDRVVAVPPR